MRGASAASHLSARGRRSRRPSSHQRRNTGSAWAAACMRAAERRARHRATGTTSARCCARLAVVASASRDLVAYFADDEMCFVGAPGSAPEVDDVADALRRLDGPRRTALADRAAARALGDGYDARAFAARLLVVLERGRVGDRPASAHPAQLARPADGAS